MISDKEYKEQLDQWQLDSDYNSEKDLSYLRSSNPLRVLYDTSDPIPRNPISRIFRTRSSLKRAVLESLDDEIPRYATRATSSIIVGENIPNEPEDFYKQCQADHKPADCVKLNSTCRLAITDTRILLFGGDRWHVKQTGSSGITNWREVVEIPIQEISEVLFRYRGPVGGERGCVRYTYNNTEYNIQSVGCGKQVANFIAECASLSGSYNIDREVKFGNGSSHSEFYHLGWTNSLDNIEIVENERVWKYNSITPKEFLNWHEKDSTTSQLEHHIKNLINEAEHINEQYMGSATKNLSEKNRLEKERRILTDKINKYEEFLYIAEQDEGDLAQSTAQEVVEQQISRGAKKSKDVNKSKRAHEKAKSREPPVEIGDEVKFGIIEFTTHHTGEQQAVGRVEGFTLFTIDVPETKEPNDVINAKILYFNRDKESATARYID